MNKIAVGPEVKGKIELDAPIEENINAVADGLDKSVDEVTVVVLERERNNKIIDELRKIGTRVKLIQDGDLPAAIATCLPESGIDMLLGIGAAPEGVLSAVAMKHLDGDFQARLWLSKTGERERAKNMGIEDVEKLLRIPDIIKSDSCIFVATGVMDGAVLKGVSINRKTAVTHSVIMENHKINFLSTRHNMR